MLRSLTLSLIVLTLLLAGCGAPEKETQPAIEEQLYSLLSQQYNDLRTQYIAIQVEKATLESTLAQRDGIIKALQAVQATTPPADYETYKRAIDEANQLRTQALNDLWTLQIEYDNIRSSLQFQMDETQRNLDSLNALKVKLAAVNNRTDITTTSNLTAEKRANFYQMWDLWYPTLWK